MSNLINLRQERKRRQRQEKAAQADENRTRHGQTKATKRTHSLEQARADRELEGKRREGPDTEPSRTE
ncbi:MAG: DUF4169 family protein [Magnetospiraceae bacterium]